jgi:hypothetical protein
MTYFEYQEIVNGASTVIISIQAMFFTVFAAYLVMTYFVGKKLSSVEAITIAAVYTAFSGLQIFATVNQMFRVTRAANFYFENVGGEATINQVGIQLYGIIFIYVASWAIGIAYMIKVRRSKSKG